MMVKDRHAHVSSALVLLAALAGGCGSDDSGGNNTTGDTTNGTNGNTTDGTNGNPDGGGGGEAFEVDLTLVPASAMSPDQGIGFPHDVRFYDETGAITDVNTAIHTMKSEEGTGLVKTTLMPAGDWATIHVIGSDLGGVEMSDWTYDVVILNTPPNTGDPLLRISTLGLSELANQSGDYENRADRAVLSGAIYHTPGGPGTPRGGAIGCVQIYLGDSTTHLDADSDQRYSEGVLPTTPDQLDQTDSGGRFYFGNIPTGSHTLRAVDTTTGEDLATVNFDIPLARQDAVGPGKNILYLIGIDVPGDVKPGC